MAKKANADVLDAAPDGAVDLGSEQMESQASTAVSVFKTLPVWQPHPTLVEVAKLKEKHVELLAATDVSTKDGYKTIKQAKIAVARIRTAVDNRRLEEGRSARDYVKAVNEAGNTIIQKLEEIESPLEAALNAEDMRQQSEALAAAKAIEEEQRRKEDQRLAFIKAEEDRAKAEAQAFLDQQRAALEAQRKAMDEQMADMKRQQEELKQQQEAVRAENERLQAEARAKIDEERRKAEAQARAVLEEREATERVEREKAAEERRKVQAEADRIANEKRIEQAKKDAADQAVRNEQARVAREAEAKKVKDEKDRKAAEKKAAQAPDKDKLSAWADSIQAIERPTVKDKEAEAVLKDASAVIAAAMTRVYSFCGGK